MRSIGIPVMCAIVVGLLIGCGTAAEKPHPAQGTETYTHVVTTDTMYYLAGPQQARPPEGTFAAGTRVVLIRDAGSYVQVRSETGVEAYISKGSLQPIVR